MSPQLKIVKVSRIDGTSETKTVFKCTSWKLKDVLACINELAGGKKIFRNIYLTLAFNNATSFHFVNFSCRNKNNTSTALCMTIRNDSFLFFQHIWNLIIIKWDSSLIA